MYSALIQGIPNLRIYFLFIYASNFGQENVNAVINVREGNQKVIL